MALGLAGLTQGCWPAWKTVQRERSFKVEDEAGKPIASATVAYVTISYPYGNEDKREIAATGPDGRAQFLSDREWQLESLMIHGSRSYTWRWCVSAPGYETHRSTQDWGSASNETVIRLRPGDSRPCTTAAEVFVQPLAEPLGTVSSFEKKAARTAEPNSR